jgi:hypothetical protein
MGKISEEKLFCINCQEKHTANFQNCSVRQEYIKSLNGYKNRNKKSNPHSDQNRNFRPAPQLNDFNFPPINQNYAPGGSAWQNSNSNNYSQQNSPINNISFSNDLFTPQQCFSIFKEFISKLSNCNTRQEQLYVIGEITLKYIK